MTAASSAASDDDFDALYGGTGNTGSAAAYDPWEPFNRKVHKFNNAVDRGIARPLATAYTHVVPRFARTGVSNFFSNLRAPVTITNQLLQGRGADAWDSLGRFLMNSTLGIGGLFDPASKAMVPRRNEDFGQTLGAWGWRRSATWNCRSSARVPCAMCSAWPVTSRCRRSAASRRQGPHRPAGPAAGRHPRTAAGDR